MDYSQLFLRNCYGRVWSFVSCFQVIHSATRYESDPTAYNFGIEKLNLAKFRFESEEISGGRNLKCDARGIEFLDLNINT